MKNIISITLSIIIIFSMAATGSIADAQSLSNAKSQNVSARYYFKPFILFIITSWFKSSNQLAQIEATANTDAQYAAKNVSYIKN